MVLYRLDRNKLKRSHCNASTLHTVRHEVLIGETPKSQDIEQMGENGMYLSSNSTLH